jgi:hypothetical protein
MASEIGNMVGGTADTIMKVINDLASTYKEVKKGTKTV